MNLSERDRELLRDYADHIAGAYGEDPVHVLSREEVEVVCDHSHTINGLSPLMRYHIVRAQLVLLRGLDDAGLLRRPDDGEIPEHLPCQLCHGDELLDYTESNEEADDQHRVECMRCGTNAPVEAWDRRRPASGGVVDAETLNATLRRSNAAFRDLRRTAQDAMHEVWRDALRGRPPAAGEAYYFSCPSCDSLRTSVKVVGTEIDEVLCLDCGNRGGEADITNWRVAATEAV